jgi:hypothetical protein
VTCEPLTPDRKAVRVTVHLPPLKPEDLPGTQVLKVCRLVVRVSDEAIDSPPLERTLLYTLRTRPPANIVYLSDLQPKSVSAHTFSQDRGLNSVPIVLGGATYAKGLLTHPAISTPDNHAEVVYDLRNLHQYRRCRAVVGIEDVAGGGSAEFIVSTRTGQGEWQERWRSGVVKVGQPPRRADAALDGADELRLYCTDGGDGINCDHALWADAHLE